MDHWSNMEQTNNKCAEILKNSDADTNVEELVKKNEKLTEAVKKLKTFIKSSNEDFERKDGEIKKKEEEIERLETENKKLKEKLWTSKLKIKDFIHKLHEKDAEVAGKDGKIEELRNEINDFKGQNGSTGMDVDNSETFFERDDDDDLEILATPPKLFEEVTLDEDDDDDAAADVVTDKISEPSQVASQSPAKSSNIRTENAEILNVSPRNSGEVSTESRLSRVLLKTSRRGRRW